MRSAAPARFAAALLVAGLGLPLASCTTSVPLRGTDDDVFFASGRIVVNTLSAPDSILDPLRLRPRELKAASGLLGVELDYASGRGNISQDVPVGRFLRLESESFNGPARVSARFDHHTGSVAARGGVWLIDAIGIEGIGGLGFSLLDIEVESGGIEDDGDLFLIGPIFGLQLTGRPLRWVGFYGRASIIPGFGDDGDDGDLSRGELGVELMPIGGLSLRGGWYWWDLDMSRHHDADIDLGLEGPFAGMELRF